jgi:dynein heavy chain
MILLKTIRPDKISLAIQNYVIEKIGETFVKPPTFKLSECFSDSSNTTPLVFVLSTGSDPIAAFKKFVIEQGMDGRYDTISLGSGQDKPAEEKIEKGK